MRWLCRCHRISHLLLHRGLVLLYFVDERKAREESGCLLTTNILVLRERLSLDMGTALGCVGCSAYFKRPSAYLEFRYHKQRGRRDGTPKYRRVSVIVARGTKSRN